MKKAILLYNPKAGHRAIMAQLDYITKKIQKFGYELHLYRSMAPGDIKEYIKENITVSNTDLILISGGDGTVNDCITGMLENELDIPLLILPLGTANDFATTAGISSNVEECIALLETGNLTYVDVGKANDMYFINVCNMGLFSGVSHNVDPGQKRRYGRLAYYVKSIEEFQNYAAMDMTITTEQGVINERYLLVLVFNGKGAGGLLKLAKHAEITDGVFDLVCVKDVSLVVMPALFVSVLQGEHLDDPNVDYMTCRSMTIECHNQDEKNFVTDVDGEEGPDFPIHIEVISDKIRMYLPN